jgi:hypothetical protein
MTSNIPFSVQVKNAAHDRWFEIFNNIEPNLRDAVKKAPNHVPSPKRGGDDGFRFFKDGNACGGGVDNLFGVLANGFDVLMWLNESSFGEELSRVAQYLGMTGSNSRNIVNAKTTYEYVAPIPSEDELHKRRLSLRKVWNDSFPLEHYKSILARTYLTTRGLDINKLNLKELSKNIHFHPNCSLWYKGKYVGHYPAILSLVKNEKGVAVTIHRTYLDRNGNKLNLQVDGVNINAKKLMSACIADKISGSAVRLGNPKKELHIAEGLETCLSVSQSINEDVWMCGNSTLLGLLELCETDGIERIFDWADKDRPHEGKSAGTEAAMTLSERMKAKGIEVITLFPESPIPENAKSIDWNDVLIHQGERALVDAMNNYQRQYM